jgi:hypothetical protein
MTNHRDTRRLERFAAYAAAFETAYATDDWSVLEPFFTEDATTELNGARVDGRPGVLRSFQEAVAMFDRRFDSRTMRFVEGPEISDGVVRIKTLGRYERAGLEPLELIGEEWFHFEGDRIQRHIDHVLNVAEVMAYLASHGEALRPLAPPERQERAAEI